MIRLTLFCIFSTIAFFLTCHPKKGSLRTYLICILILNIIGVFEVGFLHAINRVSSIVPYIVTCFLLALQWCFWRYGMKQLEGIITVYTGLIFFFSII